MSGRRFGEVTTRLPRENATQGLLLRRVRALVQVERQLPIAILHVAGGVDEQGHIETIETHAIALTGVPCQRTRAVQLPSVGGEKKTHGHAASQLQASR